MSKEILPGPTMAVTQRLVSLDALRGFDMFWILGMEELAAAVGKATDAPWAQVVASQLSHVPWDGFHFLDLIFPLFVFIAGVSSVFSLEKSLAVRGRAATFRKLLVRALVLYALGLWCYGGISKGVEEIRWLGVLQRIAIAGFAAGSAYLFLGRRGRWAACAGLLLGYWALMTFVPVPGGVAGDFAEGQNLANWLDARYLPGFKWNGDHDPEGLLSTLPAIASALLGVFAGEWLRRADRAPGRKVAGLLVAGVGLAAAGWAWHAQFPVIKNLWTSSFVLVAGGYSCLLLGGFYWLVDVAGCRRWAAPFVWIGMNPITLYLTHYFVEYKKIAERLAGGPVGAAFGHWEEAWIALLVVLLSLVLAWFLHARRIFLRV
jgi:predicted acyltransferase